MTIGSPPGAGTFCREGPPSLLHFHHNDVFADDDATEAAAAANGDGPAPGSSPVWRQRKRVVLALYDLDGTLIRPKSGYKFPRGSDDWMWWRGEVPHRLRADVAAGRHVVVLSNQNVHGRLLRDVKEKIRMIAHAIDDIPFRVLAALDRDKFRKPNIGMLEYLLRMYAERGWEIDLKRSFYVGDAAGRAGDHSADDRDMARNANLTFRTPEYHFSLPHPIPKCHCEGEGEGECVEFG